MDMFACEKNEAEYLRSLGKPLWSNDREKSTRVSNCDVCFSEEHAYIRYLDG